MRSSPLPLLSTGGRPNCCRLDVLQQIEQLRPGRRREAGDLVGNRRRTHGGAEAATSLIRVVCAFVGEEEKEEEEEREGGLI